MKKSKSLESIQLEAAREYIDDLKKENADLRRQLTEQQRAAASEAENATRTATELLEVEDERDAAQAKIAELKCKNKNLFVNLGMVQDIVADELEKNEQLEVRVAELTAALEQILNWNETDPLAECAMRQIANKALSASATKRHKAGNQT